jgi:hypothetical protein
MQSNSHQSKFQQYSSKHGYKIARLVISAYVIILVFASITNLPVKNMAFN